MDQHVQLLLRFFNLMQTTPNEVFPRTSHLPLVKRFVHSVLQNVPIKSHEDDCGQLGASVPFHQRQQSGDARGPQLRPLTLSAAIHRVVENATDDLPDKGKEKRKSVTTNKRKTDITASG